MKETIITSDKMLPVLINAGTVKWTVIGGGQDAMEKVRALVQHAAGTPLTVIAADAEDHLKKFIDAHENIELVERDYEPGDIANAGLLVAATGNRILNQKIRSEAGMQNILVCVADDPALSDFQIQVKPSVVAEPVVKKEKPISGEQRWKNVATRLVIAFFLMVLGHLVISYLPLPTLPEIWEGTKPYFNREFGLFVLAGFLAQMVDGLLSMGYGVTSATCLISFGVNPVSVSAAIHTSEIFASGISGYSHYKFGNVNKKLFRHLVIPGVVGAILGALMLVFIGEKAGKWLMPVIALYAMFLGLKILFKAFQQQTKNTKVKRVGWLAGAGGFLDSFGGGGWGPIVTSTLISKGKSPKYTVGSVSLTEFFITLASAFTFFVTVGISHWNIVLGLLIGGAIAAPFAARLAGKLPRKTMMIAVGIMVMIWCIRMIVKSFI